MRKGSQTGRDRSHGFLVSVRSLGCRDAAALLTTTKGTVKGRQGGRKGWKGKREGWREGEKEGKGEGWMVVGDRREGDEKIVMLKNSEKLSQDKLDKFFPRDSAVTNFL